MAEWGAFAGFAGVVLAALLFLAHASQSALDDSAGSDGERRADAGDGDSDGDDVADEPGGSGDDVDDSGDVAAGSTDDADGTDADAEADPSASHVDGGTVGTPTAPADAEAARRNEEAHVPVRGQLRDGDLSTAALLLNVALSQGLLGGLLALGAWYAGVPLSSLGLDAAAFDPAVLLAGAGVGVGLYVANEAGAAVGERFGLGGSEQLRTALAPDSARGWILLLGGVLPVVAAFEEFLFRAVLVGAFAEGFGVSPWALAVLSSVAFAAGHGAQGPLGVVVTGALGLVLAAAFVVTGSLAAVVVAHYLVNALEFVVNEGLGVDWSGRGDGSARGEQIRE